jgi:hypothetical protein
LQQQEERYLAVAVMFKLEIEFDFENGSDWPPVSSESLWVQKVDEGRFRLDNVPFFA